MHSYVNIHLIGLCVVPLCLNIVGNLVRTYGGSGWEEEIPQILKKDMKSLASGEGAGVGESSLGASVLEAWSIAWLIRAANSSSSMGS